MEKPSINGSGTAEIIMQASSSTPMDGGGGGEEDAGAPTGDLNSRLSRSVISPGSRLPNARIKFRGELVDVVEFFQERMGVLFGVPGAFTPVCTERHLPGFRDHADDIKRRVDFLGCVAVNDPFVLKAWAKSVGVESHMTFICDSNAQLVRKLGLAQNLSSLGMGIRCRRFAMIVGPKSEVRWVGLDNEAFADVVLKQLDAVLATDHSRSRLEGEDSSSSSLEGICSPVLVYTDHFAVSRNGVTTDRAMSEDPAVLRPAAEDSSPEDLGDKEDHRHHDFSGGSSGSARHVTIVGAQRIGRGDDSNESDGSSFDDLPPLPSEHLKTCTIGCNIHDISVVQGDESLDVRMRYHCKPFPIMIHSTGRQPLQIDTNDPEHHFGFLRLDQGDFYTRHVHFHSPSVHAFNTHRRPLEMHVTHFLEGQPGRLLVLSVTFQPSVDNEPNAFLNELLRLPGFPPEVGGGVEIGPEQYVFDLPRFLKDNTVGTFYRFTGRERFGKIMAPKPGVETRDLVTWFIARDPVPASQEQINLFKKVCGRPGDAFRRLQSLKCENEERKSAEIYLVVSSVV